MKKFFYIFTTISVMIMSSGCTYNELPPKTENASTNYILPKGELPTEAEKAELEKIREDYYNSIN
jgi:hypothetical protein